MWFNDKNTPIVKSAQADLFLSLQVMAYTSK